MLCMDDDRGLLYDQTSHYALEKEKYCKYWVFLMLSCYYLMLRLSNCRASLSGSWNLSSGL